MGRQKPERNTQGKVYWLEYFWHMFLPEHRLIDTVLDKKTGFVLAGKGFPQFPQEFPGIAHFLVGIAGVKVTPGYGTIFVHFFLAEFFLPFSGGAANPENVGHLPFRFGGDQFAMDAIGAVNFSIVKFLSMIETAGSFGCRGFPFRCPYHVTRLFLRNSGNV
jgi:hypothetical protein